MRAPRTQIVVVACLVAAFGAFAGCSCGPDSCPGGAKADAWRCLNGITPQWCAVGGGPGGGGDVPEPGDFFSTTPNTYTWESMPSCWAPNTCVVVGGNGIGAVCQLTAAPADLCPRTGVTNTCWEGYPVECVGGSPVALSDGPCPGVCVRGVCALSSTLDPNCPDDGGYATYCSAAGPVACYQGLDVNPDAGYWPGPIEDPPPDPCLDAGNARADAGNDAANDVANLEDGSQD